MVSIQATIAEKSPAYDHLFLGLLLIACSWVGWRQSRSPGVKEKITTVFSASFLGLLLDVFLVVLYFIVVQSVEIIQTSSPVVLGPSSALPESRGLFAVFAVYAAVKGFVIIEMSFHLILLIRCCHPFSLQDLMKAIINNYNL